MKKIQFMLLFAVLFAGAPAAYAQGVNSGIGAVLNADIDLGSSSAQIGAEADADANIDAGSSSANTNTRGNANANVEGTGRGEEHRSKVATFVQSLLATADRDTKIGTELRAVAQSQQDSASTTAEAMAKLEKRSGLMSFMFGSDWKNVGTIRSAIAQNDKDIARLEQSLEATTDTTTRTALQADIDALEESNTELEAFLEAHAESFSLFGWFTKLFVKADATASAK